MIELTELQISDTAELRLTHPGSGKPLEATIELYGEDSAKYREAMRENARRRMDRQGPQDIDQIMADGLEILVSCTKAWDGIHENGEPTECTPENVRRIYKSYNWIREQVDVFVAKRRNFMKGNFGD